MIPKITITGTESTGKTTLASQLSAYFRTTPVEDISRNYIASLQRPYHWEDVIAIAEEIIATEQRMMKDAERILISDNDLINIKIWLQYYDWEVPEWLTKHIVQQPPDLYLVTYIDVPWQADDQRANPLDREALYQKFIGELESVSARYKILKGSETERLKKAITWTEVLLCK